MRRPVGYRHEPVMLDEVVRLLAACPDGVIVDATVGGGGHAAALLDAHRGLRLVGVDRDPRALEAAAARLEHHRGRVVLRRARFDRLEDVLDEEGHERVAAFLFDLGVSSEQLDRAERGFSYRHDGPLDMRMDPDDSLTAAHLVNRLSKEDLATILYENADERHSRRVAAAIVAQRPLLGTAQLARVVAAAVPASAERRGGHPARRAFQALRIAVNSELEVLAPALQAAVSRLVGGGRLVVLSYHSGEDRIVKSALRREAGEPVGAGPELLSPRAARLRLLGRRARKPSAAETQRNPRASAARLRAAERIGGS